MRLRSQLHICADAENCKHRCSSGFAAAWKTHNLLLDSFKIHGKDRSVDVDNIILLIYSFALVAFFFTTQSHCVWNAETVLMPPEALQ